MHLEVAAVDPVVVRDDHARQLDVLVADGLERAVERLRHEVEPAERRALESRARPGSGFGWCRSRGLAHLPGDVGLRARVGGVGEDLLGVVELDDAAGPFFSSSSSSTVKNAVLSDTRAACCMLWVTITIE